MIRAKAALCCVVCGSVAILLGADAAVRDGSITPLADAAAFPDVGISGLPEAKLAALPETNVATFPDVNTGLPDTNSTAAAVTESASAANANMATLASADIADLAAAGMMALPDTNLKVSAPATSDACLEACIDRYLWSLYERMPKLDTVKVSESRKVTVKRKGKTRTVTKTVTKLVDEDFTWKDAKAADKAGMSLMDYVIGGMDRRFKLTLYHAFRAADDAGLEPGITSAFRDDYRQAIASGNKARSDRSFHGGSSRGGYGHGLAVDVVSVKGATRSERWVSSEIFWKWIDTNGKDFRIGRPYLDRDAPHVGPMDGKEYMSRRGGANVQQAVSKAKKRDRVALNEKRRPDVSARHKDHRVARIALQKHHGMAIHGRTARFSKAKSG